MHVLTVANTKGGSGKTTVALSLLASVEGTNNMRDNYAPALGVVASRTFSDKAAMYVSPMFVSASVCSIGEIKSSIGPSPI